MFYPVELLSYRRRGKLAACWLAALTSEKIFKKHYNCNMIKKISITETSKEIVQIIQSHSSSKSKRFSLYLSSQLMCGLTKIYSYQLTYYEKELFEMQKVLDPMLKKKGDEFDGIEVLEPPAIDLPLSNINLFDQLRTDLHILPGEDIDNSLQLQIVMEDAACLNFGHLEDEELNFLLKRDDNILSDLRMLQINMEEDISEKMADITIAEGIQERKLPQEILSPVLGDVSKRNKSKERLSLTPQKRQPHQMQVETPTKRRRLSFEMTETVPPAPVENVAVPASAKVLVSPQRLERNMELESLHSSCFDKPSKKRKVSDSKIVLSNEQLEKWRKNVNIHCKELIRASVYPTPAIYLFNQPSHRPIQWNINSRNFFIDCITRPFTNEDENVVPAEHMQLPEIIRVEETISRLNLPTEDLSTFRKTDTAITAEAINSTANILPIYPTNIIHETTDVSMVPGVIPDTGALEGTSTVEHRPDQERINIIDESFEDIEMLLKRQQRSSKTKHISVSSTTSVRSPQPPLTRQDILAILDVLLNDSRSITFREFIPKDTYTKEDATTAFEVLLKLHEQGKVVLQQENCSADLKILKYQE